MLESRVSRIAAELEHMLPYQSKTMLGKSLKIYGIPRGGLIPAALIAGRLHNTELTEDPSKADVFIDDLIESGSTRERYDSAFSGKPFRALYNKQVEDDLQGKWLVFPWEVGQENAVPETIEENVARIIQAVDPNAAREGLKETPSRVAKAWQHWSSGYKIDPANVLKVFEDGAEGYDEMVVVRDIPFYSKCEHHLADIFGTATVAYIPNGKVVGLSKLSRLVDVFARRLQVQERMTCQIADALQEHVDPFGCGVILKARHMCMESRGICQSGHHTVTSALRGALKTDGVARAEFMALGASPIKGV